MTGRDLIERLERRIPERLREDLDTRRRSMMALGVAATTSCACVLIAVVVFLTVAPEQRLLGTVNTLLTAVLAGMTGRLLRRRGLVWAGNWLACLLFAGAVFAMSIGGGVLSPFVLILPVIAVLTAIIGGRRSGAAWAGVCVVTIMTFAVASAPTDAEPLLRRLLSAEHPRMMAAMTASMITVLITGFVAFSETTKREAILQIAATNRRLDVAVQQEQRARDLATAALAANSAKSAFLATMSHELRTPLNIILGYSELVLDQLQERGEVDTAEDLRRVHGAGLHLLSLIDDVLDLSRLESERLAIGHEPFDLTAMLGELALALRSQASSSATTVSVEVPPGLVLTGLDGPRVRQILQNLISNAIKFTRAGQVSVHARALEGAVEVSVRDTGIGIPTDKLELIFLPFTQVDPSTTRRYEGAGLGLALSRRLCERMGGTLTVTSTPGLGSTFVVRLPSA